MKNRTATGKKYQLQTGNRIECIEPKKFVGVKIEAITYIYFISHHCEFRLEIKT